MSFEVRITPQLNAIAEIRPSFGGMKTGLTEAMPASIHLQVDLLALL